jgi:hypothetical protein
MIVTCPNCNGRSPVNPFEQKADDVCSMCFGDGLVDTENICNCGRAARLGEATCGRVTCAVVPVKTFEASWLNGDSWLNGVYTGH